MLKIKDPIHHTVFLCETQILKNKIRVLFSRLNIKVIIYQSCQSCQELLQAKVSGPSLCGTKQYNSTITPQFKS